MTTLKELHMVPEFKLKSCWFLSNSLYEFSKEIVHKQRLVDTGSQ